MSKKQLIHLSDLHIGLRKKESDLTRLVTQKISVEYYGVPVIITGDLTDSATKNQFREARTILDQLAITNPILAVPGNHDYAWKGTLLNPNGWKNWIKYFGSPLGWNRPSPVYWMEKNQAPGNVEGIGVWKDDSLVYFGIDSGDPNDKQISARGYISEELANSLKDLLRSYYSKTRIVFLHHHPFTGGLRHIFTALHGSDLLMDALRDNCELLLFGHEHEYGLWRNYERIPFIVSSHKTSEPISGNCCAITLIEIDNAGTNNASFSHSLVVV